MNKTKKHNLALSLGSIVFLLVSSAVASSYQVDIASPSKPTYLGSQTLILEFNFSYPEIIVENDYIWVYVNETNLNMIVADQPVLPTNITELMFKFGTKILGIEYTCSSPEIINISEPLAYAQATMYDQPLAEQKDYQNNLVYTSGSDSYPSDWYSYHVGGGLSYAEHVTYCILRIYPVRYFPNENQLQFIHHIVVTISYQTPDEPLLKNHDIYDLLIIAPNQFLSSLHNLVAHKNNHGVKTRLVGLEEVYEQTFWQGRDNAEQIKYFIKKAIEKWGITHVLFVGGIKGQTMQWNLPVRYSHVVPPDEQEYVEQSFLCDLYFADIYDGNGNFTSWDSNENNVFAEWNDTIKDDMDVYPDVYLGRLPCRTTFEVTSMVRKIIQYENEKSDNSWFKNLILVAGDSYNDTNQFNEGELIAEEAITVMPGFTPVKVYASNGDINRRTVNRGMNQGAGFAYFCGHGNPMSWTTHFPPDGTEWTTGYACGDMMYLRNKEKLPITIVGGCHNGQFDVTMSNIIKGIREDGLHYFSTEPGNAGRFWWNEWSPNSWAWWLTSKPCGGAIATIANTGLGTHGDGDQDNNEIADYLEILDGWLELRFLQLYGEYHDDILGMNHGETLTGYLHRFMGNNWKMDVKMVQQWQLFGDPSLKIGGYPS